jgi:hypothetical protein
MARGGRGIGGGLVAALGAPGKTGRGNAARFKKSLARRRETCISARSATVKKRAGSSVATDLDDIPVRLLFNMMRLGLGRPQI